MAVSFWRTASHCVQPSPDEFCDVDLRQGNVNKTINQSVELEFSQPDPFTVFYRPFAAAAAAAWSLSITEMECD
jgi:hypothetical protein